MVSGFGRWNTAADHGDAVTARARAPTLNGLVDAGLFGAQDQLSESTNESAKSVRSVAPDAGTVVVVVDVVEVVVVVGTRVVVEVVVVGTNVVVVVVVVVAAGLVVVVVRRRDARGEHDVVKENGGLVCAAPVLHDHVE